MQARAARAYGRALETVPPARQIVMLHEGAIRWVLTARRAIETGEIEARFKATQKAAAILDALHASLDHEAGREIAALLDRLYAYLSLRLQLINVRNDASICDEVAARLDDLRQSWAKLAADEPSFRNASSSTGSA